MDVLVTDFLSSECQFGGLERLSPFIYIVYTNDLHFYCILDAINGNKMSCFKFNRNLFTYKISYNIFSQNIFHVNCTRNFMNSFKCDLYDVNNMIFVMFVCDL